MTALSEITRASRRSIPAFETLRRARQSPPSRMDMGMLAVVLIVLFVLIAGEI